MRQKIMFVPVSDFFLWYFILKQGVAHGCGLMVKFRERYQRLHIAVTMFFRIYFWASSYEWKHFKIFKRNLLLLPCLWIFNGNLVCKKGFKCDLVMYYTRRNFFTLKISKALWKSALVCVFLCSFVLCLSRNHTQTYLTFQFVAYAIINQCHVRRRKSIFLA